MREFKLLNSFGQEFDLMHENSFFYSPNGLGFELSFETSPIGYTFLENDVELNQKTISGKILFDGYDGYLNFVRFCTNENLRLAYKPTDIWYYIDCKLQSATKTEIEPSYGKLVSEVSFIAFSTWYSTILFKQIENITSLGKTYSYEYDYAYKETNAGSVVFDLMSKMPSYTRLNILGPVYNPAWSLYREGNLVASGAVFANIPEGHKLVVDSSPLSLEIAEYTLDNAFVANRYSSSNFATERFIILPPGQSTISFSHAGAEEISGFVEVKALEQGV